MQERDIFDEKQETKSANFSCPHCRHRDDYEVRWVRRTKKRQTPRGINQEQRARFEKSRDYMVRVDDVLMCKKCRRTSSDPLNPQRDDAGDQYACARVGS